MKKHLLLILIILTAVISQVPGQKSDSNSDVEKRLNELRDEVTADLTKNLLPYWYTKMVDYENGGFFGRISGTDQVFPEEDKGGFWICPYHNGRMCMEIIEKIPL